jgi:hypothetical protein
MVAHMKTTVEIADTLLNEARKVAARQGTTLRALIERGLRRTLDDEKASAQRPFRLQLVTFRGEGLQPEAGDGSWDRVRSLAYENHGA